jgi:phosphoribosyl 1,2-cyclic phosphate phosphodiesterase
MSPARSFVFLGTGTSTGVPVVGCECRVCTSDDPKNHRTRPSALVQLPAGNVLIDTTPEMRLQLLREKIGRVHAVLFTHYHVDHLYGLDDVRIFPKYLGGPLPIYCTEEVEAVIRNVFGYAFHPANAGLPPGFVPRLEFRRITPGVPFEVLGQRVVPVPLVHGKFDVLGFRFDDVAYCTDVSHIANSSLALLRDVRVLVLDCLRDGMPHPTHLNLDQAVDVVRKLRPEQTYLTHMNHEMDYAANATMPAGVAMAYDGLRFEF